MSEGEHECDLCGDTFHTKDALRRHANDQHPGEQPGGDGRSGTAGDIDGQNA